MTDFRLQILTIRQLRAAAVFGVAAVLLVASLLAVWRPPSTAPAQAAQRYAGFWFASPNTGYALTVAGSGIDLYRTTNSAASWQRLHSPGDSADRPDFLQLVADGSLLLQTRAPGGGEPRYWLSTDGGADWRQLLVMADPGFSWSLQAFDRRTFLAVGRLAFGAGTNPELVLRWTHDGGRTWTEVLHLDLAQPAAGPLNVTANFSGPRFIDDRRGWALTNLPGRRGVTRLGAPPTVLRTDDGGQTWSALALPGGELSQGFDLPVFPGGGEHGYLLGYTGTSPLIYETQDGGHHWARPYTSRVSQFAAAADRWFSSSGGQVLVSSDWGRTWTPITPELPRGSAELGALQVTGAMLWSVPLDRAPVDLLRSSDGGWTWARAGWPGT